VKMVSNNLVLVVFILFVSDFASAGYCLPREAPPEAKDWPVCGIYMHGLFGEAPYSEKTWEIPFRNQFDKLALEKKCKIAVPIGNKSRYWNWNTISLIEMRRRASVDCQGAKFVAKPSLIGFANGANVLRKDAAKTCSSIAGYGVVTAIGASLDSGNLNGKAKACGNFKMIGPHAVPAYAILAATIRYRGGEVKSENATLPNSKKSLSQ
jgi:hypothetical protein